MSNKISALLYAIFFYVFGLGFLVGIIIKYFPYWKEGIFAFTKGFILLIIIICIFLAIAIFNTVKFIILFKNEREDYAPHKAKQKEKPAWFRSNNNNFRTEYWLRKEDRREKKLARLRTKYNKGNVTGIDIKVTDSGEFIFVGKFDMGELGVIDGEKVKIGFKTEELVLEFDNDPEPEEARQKVIQLISDYQNKLSTYSHNFKNVILLTMLDNARQITDCEFWLYYRKCADKYSDEQCHEIFDNVTDNEIDLDGLTDNYYKNGLMTNFDVDVEKFVREKFEFFDYDRFLKGLEFEQIDFSIDTVSVQFSDENYNLFCCKTEEFDESMSSLALANYFD